MSSMPPPYQAPPVVVQQKSGCLRALGVIFLVLIGLTVLIVIGFIVTFQLT